MLVDMLHTARSAPQRLGRCIAGEVAGTGSVGGAGAGARPPQLLRLCSTTVAPHRCLILVATSGVLRRFVVHLSRWSGGRGVSVTGFLNVGVVLCHAARPALAQGMGQGWPIACRQGRAWMSNRPGRKSQWLATPHGVLVASSRRLQAPRRLHLVKAVQVIFNRHNANQHAPCRSKKEGLNVSLFPIYKGVSRRDSTLPILAFPYPGVDQGHAHRANVRGA